jgi:hypothetical protein
MRALLYAPGDYWNTPPEALAFIIGRGGCGPGWLGDKIVPDKLLGLSILEACKIHDWMWAMGTTDDDRVVADRVFKNNMLRLIDAAAHDSWKITTYLRRRMALFYYNQVSLYGGYFYWEDKNPDETMRLVEA